jgi:sterol desaturase/sphingolipid hydroxylase (fatty acid hydroxylase superfamily)
MGNDSGFGGAFNLAFNAVLNQFEVLQLWLFEGFLQPLMFAVGLGGRLEEGYSATGWFLVGCLQLLVMVLLIAPLQRAKPAEPLTDRRAVRVDVLYTLIHRLGFFQIAWFLLLEPLLDSLFGALRMQGLQTFHLDNFWPAMAEHPWLAWLLYLVVFDAIHYGIHRAQHQFDWWWRLHSLHHSQRQMTMWSDNRNHLLDDVLTGLILAVVAMLIGIAPGQFVLLVAFTQLVENFQHANVRIWFGRFGERLWISPRFHRVHHSMGLGHESHGKNTLGGCNFGVLFPWWDMLFKTADFELKFQPTGVRDQVENGVSYGEGFWMQQFLGLKRLFRRT